MLITVRQRQHIVILELSGRFDFRSSKPFQNALLDAQQEMARYLVIDLAKVSFIDSAALGLLSMWHTRLREEGCCCDWPVLRDMCTRCSSCFALAS